MPRRLALLLVTISLVAACAGAASPTPAPTVAPTPEPTDIFVETPAPSAEPTPTEKPLPTEEPSTAQTYTVKKGDTMWAIARQFGVSLTALKKANPKVDPLNMAVGTVLVIPPK